MKLSLDRILEKCPKKLLALYPKIMAKVAEAQDAVKACSDITNPLIILIPGSRGSGKSEWAQRSVIAGIHDGYINIVKYATMTENGLNGSKDAFERLAPECKGTGSNGSKREPMHRYIRSGRIDFDFFGKQDIKNEQKKYDALICEEVEKWDKVQGVAALETECRHCSVIILISNNPPQSVVDFVKVHNGLIVRVDWWENTALPAHIREGYERARLTSPVYYSRFIMCQNDTDSAPWFDNTGIENFFSRDYKELSAEERASRQIVLGIDVGAGYGDESIIAKISKNTYGAVLVEVFGRYQLESPQLVVKAAQARAQTGAIEEIWDANGIGLVAMQQRAPDAAQRKALGIVGFVGNGPALKDEKIFNARTEAYAMWQRLINENQCWYVGNPSYIEQLKREMYAQVYATPEQSKGMLRLAEKKEVKKNLNGESPNIADAVAMGIWRVMTSVPKSSATIDELRRGGVRKPMTVKRWF